MNVELIAETADYVGESPRWDGMRSCLWWVDAERATLHCHDPGSNETRTLRLPANASSLATCENGVVATMLDGLYWLGLDASEPKKLLDLDPGRDGSLFNDSGCDPRGRLWIGSGSESATGMGRMSVLDVGATASRHALEGLSLPNGVGWSPAGDRMYLADSIALVVYSFPYDIDSGTLGPREELFRASRADGLPDGLAVDTDGGVWVAFWDGGCVRRLTPTGKVDSIVKFPVRRVAGCAFGGEALTDLYVTSAWYELTDAERVGQPLAGSLFRVGTDVAGTPVPLFAPPG